MPLTFGDAEDAANLVGKYSHVALYDQDCDHPCPPDIAANWPAADKRWITFAGNSEASIIDYEKYTRDFNDPRLLREWLEGRASLASTRHAWIYCDLSNTPSAAHWARGLPFRWWIATLDGVRRSPAQIADLMLAWGCPPAYAKANWVAANQWKTVPGVLDESVLYTPSDW